MRTPLSNPLKNNLIAAARLIKAPTVRKPNGRRRNGRFDE